MSVVYKKGPWSTAEDAQLLHLIQITGPAQWVKISQQMGTRSAKQCRERYHQNLKPTLRHDPITAEEGRVIEQLVEQMGKRWADIARKLNNRSDNHVKNWWNSNNSHQKRPKSSRASPRLSRDSLEDYRYGPALQPLPPSSEHMGYSHHHHHHHHHHHGHGMPPSPTAYGSAPSYQQQHQQQQHSYNTHSELPSPSTISVGGEALDRVPSLMSDSGSVHSTSPKSVAMPSTPDSPPILPPLKMGDPGSWESRLAFRSGRPESQITLPPLRHAMGQHHSTHPHSHSHHQHQRHHQLPTAPSSPTDTHARSHSDGGSHEARSHAHVHAHAAGMARQMRLPSLSDAIRPPMSSLSISPYGYSSARPLR
ncbi:hypothetical protein SLS62_011392 [Diatrype stigma]|uniref:Uncharacterized protein n=1 Tax=Diatrype stigma TaxID=117547 RepID=A0AAN9UC08_9PEZI